MGLFSKIFTSKSIENFHFGQLEVDMHSHLLPGIDDGAATIENSIEMLQRFAQMGYRKIITTPHVKNGVFNNTSEIILEKRDEVQRAMDKLKIPLEFEAAAEYFFDYSFLEKIEADDLLTFSKGHVLVEYSFNQPPMGAEDMFFKLQMKGLKPILAHFERYVYYHGSISVAEKLRDRGIKIQVNIGSVVGHYGPQVQKQAQLLIKSGCVDLLASDCHRIQHLDLFQHEAAHPLLAEIKVNQLRNNRF